MLHASHGEVNFFETKELPKRIKKISPERNMYIVADSEVTGNHHYVVPEEGVELFQKDENMYMKNSSPAHVKCVLESRHDTIELPPGTWEIVPSLEYDYLTQEVRACKD